MNGLDHAWHRVQIVNYPNLAMHLVVELEYDPPPPLSSLPLLLTLQYSPHFLALRLVSPSLNERTIWEQLHFSMP